MKWAWTFKWIPTGESVGKEGDAREEYADIASDETWLSTPVARAFEHGRSQRLRSHHVSGSP